MVPEAVGLYGDAPLAVRARAWLRWAGAPFERIAAQVPASGRVLEVGCGLGVLACHLALSSKDRDVLGIDEELADIVRGQFAAKRARAQGCHIDFQLTPPGDVPDGPWDAVVLVDVLAGLDAEAREGLVNSCAEQLALGGLLVVGQASPAGVAQWMDEAGLVVSEEQVERRYRAPYHLYVGARRRSVA